MNARNLHKLELFVLCLPVPAPLLGAGLGRIDGALDHRPDADVFQQVFDLCQAVVALSIWSVSDAESVCVPLVGLLQVEEEECALDRDEPM